MRYGVWRLAVLACLLAAASCATPQVQAPGSETVRPEIKGNSYITGDGVDLALEVWQAETSQAVLIGLHGMNDYAKTFRMPGPWLADHGITTYAYDQRGFGRAPQPGIWPGEKLLTDDLIAFAELVRERHPNAPIYLMGVSMGAAVTIAAFDAEQKPMVDGVILVSPAVWGWSVLNPFYKASLWIAAHVAPKGTLTGQSLEIWPSDNIEMLRDNYSDDLMIKKTRTDAIYGLVGLMDAGYLSVEKIGVPVLVLYGAKDEIIPRAPVEAIIPRLNGATRVAFYQNGYHMLLRDLQAETVWADIASWISDNDAPFPSGAEVQSDG